MKRINLRVFGKVQGVMFRASAQEAASALGLAGFVRNEDAGHVFADVQGGEERILRFLEWCKKGPPGASVERVEWEWILEIKPYSKFVIKYD